MQVQISRAVRQGAMGEIPGPLGGPGMMLGEQSVCGVCWSQQEPALCRVGLASFSPWLQKGGSTITIEAPCFYRLGLQEEKGLAQDIARRTWATTTACSHPCQILMARLLPLGVPEEG